MQDRRKVLITGSAGYIAGRMLPEFRERYQNLRCQNRQALVGGCRHR